MIPRRKRLAMRELALALFVLLTACKQVGEVKPLAVPDEAAMPPSTQYVTDGNLVAGPPLPGLHFAPSEGTCARPARPLAFSSCCGGSACNGHCVYAEDRSSTCSCFGEAGGCRDGMVCSKLAHRCVKTDEVKPR